MSLVLALHTLAAVIWVGGMTFAYCFLRPAAGATLDGSQRQSLWQAVFGRFFPVVWLLIAILLASGYYMLFGLYGGFAGAGVHIHIMHGLGLLMMLLFAHIFFAPWRRFRQALDDGDTATAAAKLEQIRLFVAINLGLGLIVVAVASGGRLVG